MSYVVTIRSNAAQVTAVVVSDLGLVIPPFGGNPASLTDEKSLQRVSESASLRTLCTDDAYGAGSSTLILNDGTNDVAQADVETFLSNIRSDIADGAYGLFGNDDSGESLTQPDIVRAYTAGVAVRDTVYQKADGSVDKADATALATMPVIGFVSAIDVPSTGFCRVRSLGDLGGFTGLTPKSIYIAGTSPGSIVADDDTGNPNYPDATPGSKNIFQEVGQAKDATTLFTSTNRDFEEIN